MKDSQFDADVERYLTTLRRIPKEVRQSMATRTFDMDNPESCVCGWAIRDALRASVGQESEDANSEWYRALGSANGTAAACAREFAGAEGEWAAIFDGVCDDGIIPAIETAFTIAVAETVPVRHGRRSA